MTTITAELTEGYVVRISDGRHQWLADEPLDAGGTDVGPSPYELLLGSLAACTAITVSLYVQRKGFAVTRVNAEYTFDRVHAEDCATCDDDATGVLDRVRSHVVVEGDFDAATAERVRQIVSRCPVHRTLEAGVHFDETVEVRPGS
ncbi:MAG: OsmC family protein [Acidimicrobiales bacterium]|jgi:putative redox protein|nr:OsmC family protein [Acidimicrobiales bacterium]